MATIASQILQRVDAVLKAAVPSGTTVYRSRTEAQSLAEAPSINVLIADHASAPFSDDMDQHELALDLRIYVRDDDPLIVAEALHAAIHTALVGDATLSTLCDSVRHREAQGEPQEADTPALVKKPRYLFRYCIPKTTL